MKPIIHLKVKTLQGKTTKVKAVVDTGSYYTIIREDKLPKGVEMIMFKKPRVLGTAAKIGKVHIKAMTGLILIIKGHPIIDGIFISPDINSEFILGAKTMQAWDISVKNVCGKTTVHVGRDMNDPEIQTVL